MPLPKPKSIESEREFILRCLKDSTIKTKYRNKFFTRLRVCETLFKNK